MLFGLQNMQASLQRLCSMILFCYSCAYMDDVVIFSPAVMITLPPGTRSSEAAGFWTDTAEVKCEWGVASCT